MGELLNNVKVVAGVVALMCLAVVGGVYVPDENVSNLLKAVAVGGGATCLAAVVAFAVKKKPEAPK